MSSVPWVPIVRQIVNGQLVNATYTNSAIKDLIQRTDYLYSKATGLESASLVLSNLSSYANLVIVPGVLSGDIVTFEHDGTNINLTKAYASPYSDFHLQALGVLQDNSILVYGMLDSTTLTLATGDPAWTTGAYYLSLAYPGTITSLPQTGASKVRVGYYLGDDQFLLDIEILSEFYQHRHQTYEIFVDPDTYVVPVVGKIFIPVTPAPFNDAACFVFVDGKLARFGSDYLITTRSGVPGVEWQWISANTDPTDPAYDPRAYLISPEDELLLTFTLPTGSPADVTSLAAGNGNAIVTNCSGAPATKGDLKVQAISRFNLDSSATPGCGVVKAISYSSSDDKIHYSTGPVVERLLAGNGILIEQVPAGFNCQDTSAGILKVSQNLTGAYEIIPGVALRNAKEGMLGIYTYISLIKQYASGFLCKVKLNSSVDPTKYIHLIFDYFIPSEVTSSKTVILEISYLVTPPYDPVANNAGGTLDLSPTVALATVALGASVTHPANRPVRADVFTIPPVALAANGVMALKVNRLNTTDTYTGDFNILQLGYTFNNLS